MRETSKFFSQFNLNLNHTRPTGSLWKAINVAKEGKNCLFPSNSLHLLQHTTFYASKSHTKRRRTPTAPSESAINFSIYIFNTFRLPFTTHTFFLLIKLLFAHCGTIWKRRSALINNAFTFFSLCAALPEHIISADDLWQCGMFVSFFCCLSNKLMTSRLHVRSTYNFISRCLASMYSRIRARDGKA